MGWYNTRTPESSAEGEIVTLDLVSRNYEIMADSSDQYLPRPIRGES